MNLDDVHAILVATTEQPHGFLKIANPKLEPQVREMVAAGLITATLSDGKAGSFTAVNSVTDAGLQFLRIKVVLATLLGCKVVQIQEGLCAVVPGYFLLVAMDVIGKIPVGVIILLAQAICIYGCVHRPGMDFNQRIVLINDLHFVAVLLQQPGKKRGMHAGTERTLEVVIVHNGDFGVLVAAYRPSLHVNF